MRPQERRKVDTSRFAMVPRNDVPRSAFDTVHTHKTTFNGSGLVPVFVQEVLPGDTFKVDMTAFCRLSTPIVPLMDNIWFESFFFFVPNRLVWSNWERFMGEQTTPTDTTEFKIPRVSISTAGNGVGSLSDYFGITLNALVGNTLNVNALVFRAYNLIYNDWFRDEDLSSALSVPVDDGPDSEGIYAVMARGKRHDYFTSARPWPQKPLKTTVFDFNSISPLVPGGAMTFPQSGAPVSGLGVASGAAATAAAANLIYTGGREETVNPNFNTTDDVFYMKSAGSGLFPDVRVLVNDIRTANMVQIFMERNARGGTRYAELIRSHFGVVSPDARLQRPEFLGGGRAAVAITPVAQTSATGATGTSTVLGELAGVGTATAHRHGFSHSFTEHGHIIGLVNTRGDITYQNGVNRMWFRRNLFDFYFPATAHLGEQAILNKEIYVDGGTNRDKVFGYQERWAEYRYMPSRVSGSFRSTSPTPLDMWHLAEQFTATPLLDGNWIEDKTPFQRVLQVSTTSDQDFLLDAMFRVRMVRPLPMFSVPGMGPRL